MALITQSDIDVSISFDYSVDPKVFIFTDNTDYTTLGIPLIDIIGIFTIVGPDGLTKYTGSFATPDIDANVSLTNSVIQLPLDVASNVLHGTYTITYSIENASEAPTQEISKAFSVTHTYDSVKPNLVLTLDCDTPEIKSEDTATYIVGGVTPTFDAIAHDLFYPPISGEATLNGTALTVTSNTVWAVVGENIEYSSTITNDLTYVFPDHTVIDQVTGNGINDFNCDDLCEFFCAVQKTYDNWQCALESDPQTASAKEDKFNQALSELTMAREAQRCGNQAAFNQHKEAINELINCECAECTSSVEAGTLFLVTGSGGSGDIVIVAGSGSIDVGVASGGGTTTYTVSLNAALLSKLNTLTETVLTSPDSSVTIGSSTSGYTKTWTLTTSVTQPDLMSEVIDLDFSNKGAIVSVSDSDTVVSGTKLQSGTTTSDNAGGTFAAWVPLNNCFTLTGYSVASAGDAAIPTIQIIEFENVFESDPTQNCEQEMNLAVEVISWDQAGTIKFRLTRFGLPVTNQQLLNDFNDIKLAVKLHA